jgi:hypothetical protein
MRTRALSLSSIAIVCPCDNRLELWHDDMAEVDEQEERIWGRDVLLNDGLKPAGRLRARAAARDGSRGVIVTGSHELGLADNAV